MSMSDAAGLTITAVSARTGVSVPTLRAWEDRHGFPRPVRLPGGHRRYTDDEVARITAVVDLRADGRSLESAIAHVLGTTEDRALDQTIFAALRRRRPDLPVQVVGRAAMLAMSRAIEDECAARADRAHLAIAFQRADLYRRTRDRRWRAISRRAASTLVFADFARSRDAADGVREIAIPAGAAEEREWAVVCDGVASAAVLAGWERPDGRFEAIWSVEGSAVRVATDVARALATSFAPALELPPATTTSRPDDDPLQRAMSITARAIAYLDR